VTELRSDVFRRALETLVGAGDADPASLFTEDVTAWSPVLNTSSLDELREAVSQRDEALSTVSVVTHGVNSGGSTMMAEWRLEADHTGPLVLSDDLTVEATGRHIHLGGATFAEFKGEKICAIRSYFDEMGLTEQLMATP
jgi:predicted ester cyclase